MKKRMERVAVLLFAGGLLVNLSLLESIAQGHKFTKTCIYRVGGSALSPGDENVLAKHDVVTCARRKYYEIGGNTWAALRSINPDIKIYLYQLTRASFADADSYDLVWLSNLARWNVSRDHSMGSLYGDNPELILLDEDGGFIINPDYPREILHDVGSVDYQNYWIEATIHDIVDQPWRADGVFGDITTIGLTSLSAIPVKYPTDEDWSAAMNDFINAAAAALHNENTKLSCNRTGAKTEFGYAQWIELDRTPNPPDAVLEEGSFAVKWGAGDVQFYQEELWRRQVDIMAQIHNSDVHHQSHSDLHEGESGTDNYGKPVTFWDIFWYSLASFQIGKNTVEDNSYFGFSESYNEVHWYDELDHIDLGDSVGTYEVVNHSGNNIYCREFEKGYVFVNPTRNDVSSIQLPVTCKQLTHDNFKNDPATIPNVATIELQSHRGTFLLIADVEGPLTSDVAIDPVPINEGAVVFATVDDTTTGGSNIEAAAYFDGSWWTDMVAVDGAYDEVTEGVQGFIPSYPTPGVYEIHVMGRDEAGNEGNEECALLAVYDPDGGFVTGGGWMWSPAGAYADDPSLEGKANFGFVSKYKKGATEPTGQAEFVFKTADFNFHSSSYDWLVVTGADYARFKGWGTINDQGDYRFMLSAGDSPDTFRIRIWEEDEATGLEFDVYDNGFDQDIGAGSIVIHRK